MGYDLQKASVYKRAAAWLFDAILISILAVGIAFLLSALLGFDGYSDTVSAAYAKYEEAYAEDSILEEECVKLGKFQGYETIAYIDNVMALYDAFCQICPAS